MANLRTDFQIHSENPTTFYSSKNVMDTARKHTVKKQAFGELKNVIHNQPSQSKSLKDVPNNHTRLTKPKQFGVLKASGQHKQHLQNSQPTARTFTSSTAIPKNEEADIELLDYFDFAPKCCSKPYKSDRQIWADMNMFNDSVIDNLIQSAYNDDDDDVDDENKLPPNDLGFDDSGCEDLLNFDNSKLFQSCEINDSDIGDILPPPPPPMFDLPDFEDFGGF